MLFLSIHPDVRLDNVFIECFQLWSKAEKIYRRGIITADWRVEFNEFAISAAKFSFVFIFFGKERRKKD